MQGFKHKLHFNSGDSFIKGFQEVVFSVSSFEKALNFFQKVCGWERIDVETDTHALCNLWHLDAEVKIQEALLYNPGDVEGFLRIVKFSGVKQERIRSGAHAWDSGGIFDINIRTPDMDSFYQEFLEEGWNGYADPLRYTFGIYDVSEVLLKGPDGVTIAAMQRYAPPLEGFPHMKKSSRIFNSSIIAKDMEATRDFFLNKMGFEMFFQTPGLDRKAGHNVLGIPQSLNKDISVPVDIVRPDPNNYGSIEYLELKELEGKDCSHLAVPPNLGILMLRFPVKNVDVYADRITKAGVALKSAPQLLELAPYGKVKIFAIRTPDGAWLEFMELLD
ncbi:MAG: VOC family protein [Bacteroidota bacterium]